MNEIALFLLLGLVAGILSGLVGIGGGVLIVPALIFLFGFTQHRAEGTTLALLVPPIGVLALWPYYKAGYVDLRAAAFIALGFLLGGFFGGKFAVDLPGHVLQRIFAVALFVISVRMFFR